MLSKAKAKAYINAPQNESHSVSQQWPEPIKRNTLPRPSSPSPFPYSKFQFHNFSPEVLITARTRQRQRAMTQTKHNNPCGSFPFPLKNFSKIDNGKWLMSPRTRKCVLARKGWTPSVPEHTNGKCFIMLIKLPSISNVSGSSFSHCA